MTQNATLTLGHPQPFKGTLATSPHTPQIESHQLFGNGVLLFITHNGEQYRLQRTRTNKLILTK